MKVSFITYHDEDNYGAILQAYATYKILNELGYDAEIINLHMPHEQTIVSKFVFALRRFRHNAFRKKYFTKTTRIYTTLEELRKDPPKSDCYIVGSDQTWNPEISKEYALAYFLDFGRDDIRRISYAASIGLSNWEESPYAPTEKVKSLLKKYHRILVREDRAVEICKDVFGVEAQQVVDPVLLFPNYPEFTGEYKVEAGKMVVYKLIKNMDFYNKSELIANAFNMHRVSVGSVRRIKGAKCPYPQSVDKWVKQFATAELVFTDSFHGTIISLLYHKPFVIYMGDPKRVGRLYSILSAVGLEDRICTFEHSLEHLLDVAKRPVDWEAVDRKIEVMRKHSINLLKEALKR